MTTVDDRRVLIGLGVVAVLGLLYSVVITQNFLAWIGILSPLVFLYLVWRFVRAHERIADAVEARSAETPEAPSEGG